MRRLALAFLILIAALCARAVAETDADFEYEIRGGGAVITRYAGAGGAVETPHALGGAPVIEIGVGAFENCSEIAEIILPPTLEIIEQSAFYGCAALERVILPEGVIIIKTNAFGECARLEFAQLPETLTEIRRHAFAGCDNLLIIAPSGSYAESYAAENELALRAPVVAAHIADGSIILTWERAPRAAEYAIYRDGDEIAVVADSIFADETVPPGATREYSVAARAHGIESPRSDIVRVTMPVPLAAPLISAQIEGGFIQLTWGEVRYAESYVIYRDGEEISIIAENAFIDDAAEPGAAHEYAVKARAGDAVSPISNVVSETAPAPPAAPRDLTARIDAGRVRLNWQAVEDAVEYSVYRDGERISVSVKNTYMDADTAPGAIYNYCVIANGAYFDSPQSDIVQIEMILAAPTGLTAEATGDGVILRWDARAEATGYFVYRGADGEDFIEIDNTLGVSSNDYGVERGAAYYYRVSAVSGEISSPEAEIGPVVIPLLAPRGVSVELDGKNARLKWERVENAERYYIYRDGRERAITNTTEYIDENIAPGETYSYKIVAYRGKIASEASDLCEIAVPELMTPGGLTATVEADGVHLTWDAVEGADNYRLYRDERDGRHNSSFTTPDAAFIDDSAPPGYSYSYAVTAIVGEFESARSQPVDVAIEFQPPQGLNVNVSAFRVILSWRAIANAEEYDVYRRAGDGDFERVAGVSAASYKDIDVSPGATYEYYVVARAASEMSPDSDIIAAQMRPEAPSGLIAIAGDGVTLTWREVERADGYRIYRRAANGGFVKIGEASEGGFIDEDIVNGAACEYYVVAHIGGIGSPQSETASAIMPLAPPADFEVGEYGGMISLSWSAVEGARGYEIYRREGDGDYEIIYAGALCLNYDSAVTPGMLYTYKVVAYNENISSPESGEREIIKPLAAPRNLTASYDGENVNLTWKAVKGARGYRIYRRATGEEFRQIDIVSNNSYIGAATGGKCAYYVVAYSDYARSEASGEIEITTSLAAPGDLMARATPEYVHLLWRTVEDAAAYDIYRGEGGEFELLATAHDYHYKDVTGAPGKEYSYYVVARSGDICSPESNIINVRIPLAAPSGLTARATPEYVNLLWRTVENAAAYAIYRGEGGEFELLATVSDYHYRDVTAAPGKEYSYYVVARAGDFTSGDSEIIKVVIPLAAPTDLTADVIDGGVSLAWQAVDCATSYGIYRGVADGDFAFVGYVELTSYFDNDVAPGLKYDYCARAHAADAESAESIVATVILPLSAPDGLAARLDGDGVILEWAAVEGARGYEIFRRVDEDRFEFVEMTAETEYADANVSPGAQYIYMVMAYSDYVASEKSYGCEITVPLPAPDDFTAELVGKRVNLEWTAVEGARGYEIYKRVDGGKFTLIDIAIKNTHVDVNISPGAQYAYYVIAYTDYARSPASETRVPESR